MARLAWIEGNGHSNMINRIRVQGSNIVTAGRDEAIRITNKNDLKWGAQNVAVEGIPNDIAVGKKDQSIVFGITSNSIVVIKNAKLAATVKTAYEPSCVALSADETKLSVGDIKGVVHVYSISATSLSETSKFEGLTGVVTVAEYSPNGQWFAACDSNRSILVWDAKVGGAAKLDSLKYHTAKPVSLNWASDSLHFVTAGLDGSIYVWDVQNVDNKIHIKDAHKGGCSEVVWVNATTVASIGVDTCMKTWSIKFN